MLIFSIETSCDETAIAILKFNKKGKFKVLANQISSQIKIHAEWGGIVPNLAAREHSKNILPVMKKTLKEAGLKLEEIDLFAVTQGPGLIPALLLGTNVAKTLSYFYQKPLIGVHHIEGHIYSNFIEKNQGNLQKFNFPILNLVISGGHTQLILMKNHLEYEIIGETQDDAVGEAFDKVAKMLGFEYPGGPIISREANSTEELIKNDKIANKYLDIKLPRPMLNSGDLNFSFSGLKTSVLYFYQKLLKENPTKSELILWKKSITKAFQDAVVDVLKNKTLKAIEIHQPKTVLLSGGVSANSKIFETLKGELENKYPEIIFNSPEKSLCGDNAVMIGVAGIARYLYSKDKKTFQINWKYLEANSGLKLKSYKCIK
jgi:N6-L-threonylcarbamoyladenine synthase